MTPTKEQQRILFVGNKRICQQIAYVLDIQNYAFTERLTKQNLDQYRDCQIYVCEFKRKSRKFLQLTDKVITQLNVQYLDDICRKIDDEYDANRKRHANDFQTAVEKETAKPVAVPTAVVTAQPDVEQPVKQPLWRRIRRGMKHPLRAAWHVVLRTKETIKQRYYMLKAQRAAVRESRAQKACQQPMPKDVKKNNLKAYLNNLRPSELLLYVLRAKPKPNIRCTLLEINLRTERNGNIVSCCSCMVPLGNLLYDGELSEIYNSTYARIVKLSSLNRSYCLCNFNKWCNGYHPNSSPLPTEKWQTSNLPERMKINFDPSCNLCCKSCRTKHYVMKDEISRQRADFILNQLLRSGWLEQVERLRIADNGEVFYSPYYRQLLTTDFQRKRIDILSNGTLFNEDNWRLLAGKYTTINVYISVDAATAETYRKVRGADFNHLMKNLTMLGDLHRKQQIQEFVLYFVVQRANFREMPDFVRLGQTLGVDHIQFQRLINFGSFTNQELLESCLILDNQYLDYELWCVLQDPIFKDPIVDLRVLQRYIDASEKRYRKRYEREQKAKRSV